MAAIRTVSAGSSSSGSAVNSGPGATEGHGARTATVFACVATLSNTLLGVSVVGVAGGFARAGCAVGTFYLIVFACLAGSGLHLLARSSMTVSAAAKRSEDAKAAEEGGAGKGGTTPPPSSFRAVALVGAPRWAFLIDLAVALKCFGVATSYLVVIGDLMPTAMADIVKDSYAEDSFLLDRRLWVTAGFFLAAPLAFSRTLGALKYTATLAIGLVGFLALMVMSFWVFPGLDACPDGGGRSHVGTSLVDSLVGEDTQAPAEAEFSARRLLSAAAAGMLTPSPVVQSADGAELLGFAASPGLASSEGVGFEFEGGEDRCFEGPNAVGSVRTILQTLPIFVFCFTCHQNIFTICNEIVRPTPARVDAVIVCAMLVATTTYLSLSWGAYATFGVGVEGDLLETYPRTGLLTAARISVSILVMSCYPLQAHPSRLCILSTWKAFSVDMQEAYASLATADTEDGSPRLGVTAMASPAVRHTGSRWYSSSPATPLVGGGGGGAGGGSSRSPYSENLNSASSSGCGTREGRVRSASSGGERGRRRVVGGAKGGGGAETAGADAGPNSPRNRDAEREEELEALLGEAAAPPPPPPSPAEQQQQQARKQGQYGLVLPYHAAAPNSRGVIGDDDSGAGQLRASGGRRQGASHAGDEESADVAPLRTDQGKGSEIMEDEAFWTSPEGFRHVLVTGAFLGLSYAIAMTVNDLGVLLEIVGATGSTTIAFILPGLLYLNVHPEPHPKRSLAALQLAVGLLIIPVALTFIALGESAERRR